MYLSRISSILGSSTRLRKEALLTLQRSFSITQIGRQNVKHYTPNKFEKRCLVWTGKYKTIEDIPSHVSYEEMERCRNKVRIRLANVMIALTIVGCCIMIYSGKQAVKRGESMTKQNLDWHARYNEQAKASKEN